MKTRLCLLLTILGMLTVGIPPVRADSSSWVCYAPVGTASPVPSPNGTSAINCIMADNSGGYVAVWDDATNSNVILEDRGADGTQFWQQTLALAAGEDTRVVLGSATRVLWCSAQRWVSFDRGSGATVTTGPWDQPGLDPTKVIIQNDILYFVNAGIAWLFDTNMIPQGSVFAAPPEGLWRSYAGAWLIDMSARTDYCIRMVAIATGIQTEIPLPTSTEGGYTEHHVLSADSNTLFVLSSISWPTNTLHFFTLTDGNNILLQEQMSFNETVTGATALSDGWLISARSLGSTYPTHYLYKVDSSGGIHPHLRIDPAAPQSYVALNTLPPRVLHIIDAGHLEIFNTNVNPWTQWWMDGYTLMYPTVDVLQPGSAPLPIGSTNYFWMSSICPNNY